MSSNLLIWSILSNLATAKEQAKQLLTLDNIDSVTRESVVREVLTISNALNRFREVQRWNSFVEEDKKNED